jgi:hypothetical protein
MSDGALPKVAARTAADVCKLFNLEEASRAHLRADSRPADFLNILQAAGQYTDAIRFLAHALPKREAVWWACVCARQALEGEERSQAGQALERAEQWVREPNEANRRLTNPAAEAAGFETPAGWAAVAAFWSGGSLTPPDSPAVAPAEDLTAKAVAGGVLLAAVAFEPEKAKEHYRSFLAQGVDIANGGTGKVLPSQQVQRTPL